MRTEHGKQLNVAKTLRYYHGPRHEELKAKIIKRVLKNRKILREKAFEVLGGKCQKCGFLDPRVFQIDHINGCGRLNRKSPDVLYKDVIRSVMKGEKKYQLLCANCNVIKTREKGEYASKGHPIPKGVD